MTQPSTVLSIGRRFLDASVDQESVVHVVYNASRNADVAGNQSEDLVTSPSMTEGQAHPVVKQPNARGQPIGPKVSISNDGRAVSRFSA